MIRVTETKNAKTAAVTSVGCKVSQYDSGLAAEILAANGYEIVAFSELADVYIINTCAVTNTADKKSKNVIKRALKRNPGAFVAAMGCWARLESESVLALGAHVIKNEKELAPALEQYFSENEPSVAEKPKKRVPAQARERTRAYIKIQDGCDKFCSYCVIPYARGRVVSRAREEIIAEAEALAQKGVKEIVLTGIHVASYGKDFLGNNSKTEGAGMALLDICRAVSGVSGIERLRLSSISPLVITEQFVNGIKQLKICPHFHVSLQSGCKRILDAMNRGYSPADYKKAITLLKEAFPGCAIWSDVIVGFPGETDGDFEESIEFIERSGIVKLHIFPFSPKKGTRAFDMPNQIDNKTKAARVKKLEALDERLYGEYLKNCEGTLKTVLYEERVGEYMAGHTENYIYVMAKSTKAANELARVRINGTAEHGGISGVYAAEV